MKLQGQIYDFGEATPAEHLLRIAEELEDRLEINDAGAGDDEAARGADLRAFLCEIARLLAPPPATEPEPLHVVLRELARRPSLPDSTRSVLQDIANGAETHYTRLATRLAAHRSRVPSPCEQWQEDFEALANRAERAIVAERFSAAEHYLDALDALADESA